MKRKWKRGKCLAEHEESHNINFFFPPRSQWVTNKAKSRKNLSATRNDCIPRRAGTASRCVREAARHAGDGALQYCFSRLSLAPPYVASQAKLEAAHASYHSGGRSSASVPYTRLGSSQSYVVDVSVSVDRLIPNTNPLVHHVRPQRPHGSLRL